MVLVQRCQCEPNRTVVFLLLLQGPIAEEMMKLAIEQGKWVFFQNCHLAPSWMPSLEHLVEQLDPTKVYCKHKSRKFYCKLIIKQAVLTTKPISAAKVIV